MNRWAGLPWAVFNLATSVFLLLQPLVAIRQLQIMETARGARGRCRWGVRMVSATLALMIMYFYGSLRQPRDGITTDSSKLFRNQQVQGQRVYVNQMSHAVNPDDIQYPDRLSDYVTQSDSTGRHLLTLNPDHQSDGLLGDDDDDSDNCTKLRHTHAGFNDSCDFVRRQCQGEMQLINYLSFILCDLKHIQVYIAVVVALRLILSPLIRN